MLGLDRSGQHSRTLPGDGGKGLCGWTTTACGGRQARSRRPASLQGEAANGKPAASMARCLGASTCRRRTNTVPRQMNFRGAAGDAGCGESRGNRSGGQQRLVRARDSYEWGAKAYPPAQLGLASLPLGSHSVADIESNSELTMLRWWASVKCWRTGTTSQERGTGEKAYDSACIGARLVTA